MDKNKGLGSDEKQEIEQKVASDMCISDIAREMNRDTRTVRKAVKNVNFSRKL